LKISYGTVYAWVKQWSVHIPFPRRQNPAETVVLKELVTYIESKKAISRYALLLIDLEKEISFFSSADSTLQQQGEIPNKECLL